jgi:hypothetical protein
MAKVSISMTFSGEQCGTTQIGTHFLNLAEKTHSKYWGLGVIELDIMGESSSSSLSSIWSKW